MSVGERKTEIRVIEKMAWVLREAQKNAGRWDRVSGVELLSVLEWSGE